MKKILHINTYDVDGVGKAVLRIHHFLINNNFTSKVLVKEKKTNNENVVFLLDKPNVFSKIIRKIKNKIFKTKTIITNPKYHFFNFNEKENTISAKKILKVIDFVPDIIIVYWISRFCNLETIYHLQQKTKAKVFFYPLDMSTLTGGCHYAWNCKGFYTNCGECPAILSENINTAKYNFEEKLKWLDLIDCEIISGTSHIEKQIGASALFKNKKINKDIFLVPDKDVFKPFDKIKAREFLQLPFDKKIIFIGASNFNDERKGLKYFQLGLEKLEKEDINNYYKNNLLILVAGKKNNVSFPFQTSYIGFIDSDETLAKVYQSVDFFVCSSIEDSGPMMINESICCGTPVVCFEMGVATDLIIPNKTGYIAKLFDYNDLGKGIQEMIDLDEIKAKEIHNNCIHLAEKILSNEKIKILFKV
ncbi:MAG: glycosyltransferase [Cytophagales bacterium]|nr:MAG: glycosyltransferase [Cytophagales bacterium]